MKKISCEFTVYNFDELSDNAKEYALLQERNRDNINYEWWDVVFDRFAQKFDDMGISNADFHFSLAYCQSDYAQIYKGDVDIEKVIKMFFKLLRHNLTSFFIDYTSIYLNKSGRIVVEFDYFEDNYHSRIVSYLKNMADKLEEILNEKVYELNCELYKALQEEYEFLTSDEQIIEKFRDMDTLFFADGRIFSF